MPLPSFQAPTARLPQFQGALAALQQRSQGLASSAWASLNETYNGIQQREAQAQAQQAAQAYASGSAGSMGSSPMAGYGQNGGIGFAGYGDNSGFGGFDKNVPRTLITTESSGNWGAKNNEVGAGGVRGHVGILQFGDARLDEAKAAGAVPAWMSMAQFGSDTPEGRAAQVSAANWHFDDIDNRIKKNGLDRYIGQTVGGVPMSWNGMRAIAHLGGFGGLSKFVTSGGKYNPADSFGTSLSEYGRVHYG